MRPHFAAKIGSKWANLFKQLLLGDRETCELDTDSVMMEPKNMKPNVSFYRAKF